VTPFPAVLGYAEHVLERGLVSGDLMPYWGPPPSLPLTPLSSPHVPFTFYDESPSISAASRLSASKKQVLAYVEVPPRTPSPTKVPPTKKRAIVTKKKAGPTPELPDEDSSGVDTSDSDDAPIVAKKKRLVIKLSSEDEEDDSSDELRLKRAPPPKAKTTRTATKRRVISPKKGPPGKRRARSSMDDNNRTSKKRKVAAAASKKRSKGINLSHLEIDEDLPVDPRLVPKVRGMVRDLLTGPVPC
jgi:hypothetical protein